MKPQLALPVTLVALFTFTVPAFGLGHELGQSKEELGLKYNFKATEHESGRVSVQLTVQDMGKLKELQSIQLVVPSDDGTGYFDLVVTLETTKSAGEVHARAHMSGALAKRAAIRLVTNVNPNDGRKYRRSWYYHNIEVKKHIKK